MEPRPGRIPAPTPMHGAHDLVRVLACALVLVSLAGCASRGAINGRVRLPESQAKDVVVMAWQEDGTPPPVPVERVHVTQVDGAFETKILVVEAGTTVEFENKDRVYHQVFSVSPVAKFEFSPTRPGEVRSTAFPKAGVAQVYCELHPKELLYVVVVPDRWHARLDSGGEFAFDRLRHGSYLLRAWHPVLGTVTRRVEVPAKEATDLQFGQR